VYFEGIDCPSVKLELVILIVIAVLLLSGDIDLSDLEHARLVAASEIAPERNKNCRMISRFFILHTSSLSLLPY
jgi:hypothetical protein